MAVSARYQVAATLRQGDGKEIVSCSCTKRHSNKVVLKPTKCAKGTLFSTCCKNKNKLLGLDCTFNSTPKNEKLKSGINSKCKCTLCSGMCGPGMDPRIDCCF
jgi:hypothetical protein